MPLYTADDLIANAPLPQPSIVGSGLFPECGTWLITGVTESGKSVLAFDICLSLILQQPLFRAFRKKSGQQGKPYFPVHRPCKILYLDNEVGPQGCHARLKSFMAARGIQVPFGDYFKLISGDYDPLLLHKLATDEKPFKNLCKLIIEQRPDILVVDPFGDYHVEDEDSNKMRVVFRYLRQLQHEFKFASILLHHESDKQSFTRDGHAIQKEGTGRSRGHSCIAQSVDTYLAIKRSSKQSQHFLEPSWEKVRHQKHPPSGQLFVDLERMHIEWFCSNREQGIPAKQQAFLDAYRASVARAGDDLDDE